ncbi:MAG: sugar phosphate isomerase/epimerase, partial [Panacibacter sp.]
MNKIGFNTLVWSAKVSDELLPIADQLKAIGYDGLECLIGSPDEEAYRRLGSHTKNIGLKTTS